MEPRNSNTGFEIASNDNKDPGYFDFAVCIARLYGNRRFRKGCIKLMTPEEQRMRRRERDLRRREWRAILESYVEFAAYIVRLKREERQQSERCALHGSVEYDVSPHLLSKVVGNEVMQK